MATTVKIISDSLNSLFNKSRVNKYKAFIKLLNEVNTESYPNGNSGYCETAIAAIAATFPLCVVKRSHGDPVSMGCIVFDPSKLKPADVVFCNKLSSMLDGKPVNDENPRGCWVRQYPDDPSKYYNVWKNRESVLQNLQKTARNSRVPLRKLIELAE